MDDMDRVAHARVGQGDRQRATTKLPNALPVGTRLMREVFFFVSTVVLQKGGDEGFWSGIYPFFEPSRRLP